MPEIKEKHGVKNLYIFGSYVRGEQIPESDIDILVEFEKGKKTFIQRLQMSKRDYKIILKDVIENIDLIEESTHNIKSLKDLKNNKLALFTILKAFENLGEATKNIPPDIKEKYPYFWKGISALRDVIIHHYWGIDIEIIWDIKENELDKLKNLTKKVLEKNNENLNL